MPAVRVLDRTAVPAQVTEGNPWPIGLVCERMRYDWSEPGVVKGTVVASNLFRPGSTWELRAAPFFPLGLAKQTVARHLRHFLRTLEDPATGARPADTPAG